MQQQQMQQWEQYPQQQAWMQSHQQQGCMPHGVTQQPQIKEAVPPRRRQSALRKGENNKMKLRHTPALDNLMDNRIDHLRVVRLLIITHGAYSLGISL